MADFTPLHRKLQLAVATYLGSVVEGTEVVAAEHDEKAPLPRIVVNCDALREVEPASGIFGGTVEVTVVTSADDASIAANLSIAAAAQSELTDEIAVLTALNAGAESRRVSDLHIYEFWPSGMRTETIERAVRTRLDFGVVAMGKDVLSPPPPCHHCDSCQSCDSCQLCDSCESCDTDPCAACQACDLCQRCDGCQLCDSCDACDLCQRCDACQLCDACQQCDADCSCDGCDGDCPCDAVCDPCQACDAVCDPCQGCDACDPCQGSDGCSPCDPVCDACDPCQMCDPCDPCQPCDGCDPCDPCQGCDPCDPCQSCDPCDPCQVCDGGCDPAG